jgi:hypothetical protein
VPCSGCGATGKIRSKSTYAGSKAGVTGHDVCDEKGALPCRFPCKEGKVRCEECSEGRVTVCLHCAGTLAATCRGCSDETYRALELCGQFLLDEGRNADSASYYEAALETARRQFADREREARGMLQIAEGLDSEGDAARRAQQAYKALEKERQTVHARMEKALARAKAPG